MCWLDEATVMGEEGGVEEEEEEEEEDDDEVCHKCRLDINGVVGDDNDDDDELAVNKVLRRVL